MLKRHRFCGDVVTGLNRLFATTNQAIIPEAVNVHPIARPDERQ